MPVRGNDRAVGVQLPYRQQVRLPPLAMPFAESMEYHALQAYPRAKGYLNYLFQFNSFAFWDSLPGSPEQDSLYDTISAADVFKVEIARYKWGMAKYDGVGYIDSSFLCAKNNLTFYYQSFPANRNHNLIFRQTFREILTQLFPQMPAPIPKRRSVSSVRQKPSRSFSPGKIAPILSFKSRPRNLSISGMFPQ